MTLAPWPFPLRIPGPAVDGLKTFAATLPPHCVLVEVGSYIGESALIFLNSGRVGMLYCVDQWQDGYDDMDTMSVYLQVAGTKMADAEARFDYNLRGHSNMLKMKLPSVEAAECFSPGSIDAVYIDACHQYESAKSDLLAWMGKVKSGGIIAGHDWDMVGVHRACLEVLGEPDEVFEDQTWMYRKPG